MQFIRDAIVKWLGLDQIDASNIRGPIKGSQLEVYAIGPYNIGDGTITVSHLSKHLQSRLGIKTSDDTRVAHRCPELPDPKTWVGADYVYVEDEKRVYRLERRWLICSESELGTP